MIEISPLVTALLTDDGKTISIPNSFFSHLIWLLMKLERLGERSSYRFSLKRASI
jgi:hypothetical protein